jgi:hypothetical protein
MEDATRQLAPKRHELCLQRSSSELGGAWTGNHHDVHVGPEALPRSPDPLANLSLDPVAHDRGPDLATGGDPESRSDSWLSARSPARRRHQQDEIP